MKRPWRIALCGSNYAGRYALSLLPKLGFQIVALLARGSRRSHQLAESLGVPLYRDAAAVDSVDAACVAIGGEDGTRVARDFLRRGIHVLQEHPVGSKDAAGTMRIARRHGAVWHINGHFGDLEAPQAFIMACQRAARKSRARTAVVLADARLAYGAFDTLSRALEFTSSRLDLREKNKANSVFCGRIGSTDSIVVVHASEGPDGADYHFGLDLTVVFEHETVHLASVVGPVARTVALRGAEVRGRVWSLESSPSVRSEDVVINRAEANLSAMRRLRRNAEKGVVPREQEPPLRSAVISLREFVMARAPRPIIKRSRPAR